MKNTQQPQAPADQQIQVPCRYSPTGYFNASPLLEVVIKSFGPDSLARGLDEISFELTRHYLETEGDGETDLIFMLRELRNAMLEGSRTFTFNEKLAKEWKAEANVVPFPISE